MSGVVTSHLCPFIMQKTTQKQHLRGNYAIEPEQSEVKAAIFSFSTACCACAIRSLSIRGRNVEDRHAIQMCPLALEDKVLVRPIQAWILVCSTMFLALIFVYCILLENINAIKIPLCQNFFFLFFFFAR